MRYSVVLIALLALVLGACGGGAAPAPQAAMPQDAPEIVVHKSLT